MNKLDAVNMMLRLVGSSAINDIASTHPDAANAIATLDRISRQIQKRGWWFNTDYKLIWTPQYTPPLNVGDTPSGRIPVPTTITTFKAENTGLIERGGFVYDKRLQTDLFTEQQCINKTITTLPWDMLPESATDYIGYYAAGQFIRDEIEDLGKKKDLEKDAGLAFIELKDEHLEMSQHNMFSQPQAQKVRLGVQPYQRNNKRFHGDPDV